MQNTKHATHKEAIRAAFTALRKQGYVTRMNFMCCGGCACAAIGDLVTERGGDPDTAKAVYYHRQDAEAFDHRGNLKHGMYFGWQGDAAEITRALEAEGLMIAPHTGDTAVRIEVVCYDGFAFRVASQLVRRLRADGRLPEGQNPDLDSLTNDVAEYLAQANVSDPTRRVA